MTTISVLKWVGSKRRLLPELRKRVPKAYRRYYEPFLGGGALFFDLAPREAVIGDANDHLINTYRTVAREVDAVITRLAAHKTAHLAARDAYYYEVRTAWNTRMLKTPVEQAAAFLYMNKAGFNGLWRENRVGEMNVPVGRYANPTIYDPAALHVAAGALARAVLLTSDYRVTTMDADRGDFAYFDPPYDPISKTSSFTAYTRTPFGADAQRELAAWARELADRGVYVMLSNNDTPCIRKLYKGFKIDTVSCSRSINSDPTKRGPVTEVLITPTWKPK